jgi:hypothetical protein
MTSFNAVKKGLFFKDKEPMLERCSGGQRLFVRKQRGSTVPITL